MIKASLPVSLGVLGGTHPLCLPRVADLCFLPWWRACFPPISGSGLLPQVKGTCHPHNKSFFLPEKGRAQQGHTGHTQPLRAHYKCCCFLTHFKGCVPYSAKREAVHVSPCPQRGSMCLSGSHGRLSSLVGPELGVFHCQVGALSYKVEVEWNCSFLGKHAVIIGRGRISVKLCPASCLYSSTL